MRGLTPFQSRNWPLALSYRSMLETRSHRIEARARERGRARGPHASRVQFSSSSRSRCKNGRGSVAAGRWCRWIGGLMPVGSAAADRPDQCGPGGGGYAGAR